MAYFERFPTRLDPLAERACSSQVGTATAGKGIGGGSVAVADGEVAVGLEPGQQAVIVWGSGGRD